MAMHIHFRKSAEEYGQRALIGKVNMDCGSPENYVETSDDSLRGTEE